MGRKRKKDDDGGELFMGEQPRLFDKSVEQILMESKPVECLGITFPNDDARRAHFLNKLREKLKDPAFRKIEGFPIGDDEDILALSDPPYYTACPNPFLADFIKTFGVPYQPKKDQYHRDPFVADVTEGKNDPVYNAHSYHTKVPHKAIMRYLLHYTEPGDVVLDGFCGTGMTGVASSFCADRTTVESLGYTVRDNGAILDETGQPFSRLGIRHTVLNDLCPAATFIACNYNSPVDATVFEQAASTLLNEVAKECAWMFETTHPNGASGKCNFILWSDVFNCPECAAELVFWEVAIDKDAGSVRDSFSCPSCQAVLAKDKLERAWITQLDPNTKHSVKQAKQVPVLLNYSLPSSSARFEKKPDAADLKLLARIGSTAIPYWFPTERMMEGGETRRNDPIGVTHVHHFYHKRNLYVLSAIYNRVLKSLHQCPTLGLWFTSSHVWATRLNRLLTSNYFKKRGGVIGQTLQGTLYISSLGIETNSLARFALRIKSVPFTARNRSAVVSTQSTETLALPSNSVDYIFTDPPFGANIMYSELNSLWEAWLKVSTNARREAVENRRQGKSLSEYQEIMERCFAEYCRVLKPGRWITVEFSNTRAAVWNSIQNALERSGFVVAHVAVLEKTHKGYRAVVTPTAVKQDLAITAYKPNGGLEEEFKLRGGTDEGAWSFVRTHLGHLPIFSEVDGKAETIAERLNYMLFDRMVAFHVQRGSSVPLSASEFYDGLEQRFPPRDGMYFLPEQTEEYDKKRSQVKEVIQTDLFVTDEASAINWLREELSKKPQVFSEINPRFMMEIGAWEDHERTMDLRELLDQGFLCYSGKGEVPSQIHAYLSTNFKELRNLGKDAAPLRAKAKDRWYMPDPRKAGDLEKLRERTLLREFEEYRKSKQKKLKIFRIEAVRAGFKKAWNSENRDYDTIIAVAQMLPDDVLQEDPKLLMYYDQALTRKGG